MPYLVIALGALLSLCGALAISAGYPIIQVERGWSGVIAGSTALSCGIVTIALGLILQRLAGLQALLETANGVLGARRETGDAETGEPILDHGPTLGPASAALPERGPSGPAASATSSLPPWSQGPARSGAVPSPSQCASRGAEDAISPISAAPAANLAEPAALDDGVTEARPQFGPGAQAPQIPPAATTEQRTLRGECLDEEKEFATKEPAAEVLLSTAEPEGQARAEVSAPVNVASIEAALHEELRVLPDLSPELRMKSAREPREEAFEPAGNSAPATAKFETEAAADQPYLSPELEPPPGAVFADEGLAIVGRYDSEGTSYVMYSDGSIEARTQHAVFHFKSMAELKSFMDTQAQNLQN